jgi:hypothetical protein
MGRPRRLVWRIYLHGLVVLVGFAACVAVIGLLLRDEDRGPLHALPGRVAALLPAIEGGEGGGAVEVGARLAAFGDLLHVDLALYTREGAVVAVAGERPPGPLGADEVAPPQREAVVVGRGGGGCWRCRWMRAGGI